MNNKSCNACSGISPKFILSCGCFLCPNCYEVSKSFLEEDRGKCLLCEKDFFVSMTIDIGKKNIINQIKRYNTKENNQIIMSILKVSNYLIYIYSYFYCSQ